MAYTFRSARPGVGPAMRHEPTILLCDHRGSGLAERLSGLESGGWRLAPCSTVRASLERLADGLPDALILDPLVPEGSAEIEALSRGAAAALPLLVVSDAERAARALAALARLEGRPTDVVLREAPLGEYRARLERLFREAAARAELDDLRHRALHDDRTELLRPEAFDRRLAEHWSAAERHRQELALVVLDLDRFGLFNKRYDHTVGDQVLGRVGDAIRDMLRAEDVAGRLGGDEFGVLLPYTRKVDAAHVVNRLRENIGRISGRIEGADLVVSASLGFETFDGRDLKSPDLLRRHAEFALRFAKQRGGNCAVYYRLLPRSAT